jgi:hypothetical protein
MECCYISSARLPRPSSRVTAVVSDMLRPLASGGGAKSPKAESLCPSPGAGPRPLHPLATIGCASLTSSSNRSTSATSRDVPDGAIDQLQ